MTAEIDADLDKFVATIRQAAQTFAKEFAATIRESLKDINKPMDDLTDGVREVGARFATSADGITDDLKDVRDAARDAGKKMRASFGDMGDDAKRLEDDVRDLTARLGQMEKAATDLNRTPISNLLGGKAPIAALNEALQEALHHSRALYNEVKDGAAGGDTLGLRALATESNKQTRQILDMLRQALKAEEQLERSRTAVLSKQIEQRTALEKAAANERTATVTAAAQRAMVAEKTAGAIRAAEIKTTGSQMLAREKANGEIRVQIARTVSKTIIAAEKGTAAAIKMTLSTIGTAGNAVLSRWSNTQRSLTRVESVEISKRRSIFVRWLHSNETSLQQSVNRQERIVRSFSDKTSKGVAGALTGRGLGMGIAGALGGFSIFTALKEGLAESSNIREQINKIRVVLDDASGSVIRFTKNASEKFGITRGAALEAAAGFAALLDSSEFSQEESAKWSKTLTALSADLASFSNLSVDEAIVALRAGLSGESEPLRRFGVFLNEAKIKAKALEMGLYDGTGAITQNAKAQATLAIVMERTSNAQGDFARTSGDYANQSRIFAARLKQVFGAISRPVKDVASSLMTYAIPALGKLRAFIRGTSLSEPLNALRTALLGVAGGLAALIAMKGAIEVLKLVGLAAKAALTPFGAVIVVAGVLGGAYALLSEKSEGFRDSMKEVGRILKDLVQPALEFFGRGINSAKGAVGSAVSSVDAFGTLLGGKLVTGARWFADIVRESIIPALQTFGSWVAQTGAPALATFGRILAGVVNVGMRGLATAAEKIGSVLGPVFGPLADGIRGVADALAEVRDGSVGIADGIGSALSALGRGFAGTGGNIRDALAPVGSAIVGFFSALTSGANLGKIASGLLNGLEQIGYFVGRVLTDKRLWIAAAGIVALGGLLAFNLLKGFVRGLRDGLDEIPGLMFAALGIGIRAAFSNPILTAGIITALFAGAAVVGYVRAAGTKLSLALGEGFRANAARGLSMPGKTRDYIGALFGGQAGVQRSVDRVAAQTKAALTTSFQRMNRDIQALGGKMVAIPKGGITDATVAETTRRLDALKGSMSEAAAAGAIFRSKMTQALNAGGMASMGLSQMLHGEFTRGLKTIKSAGGSFASALGGMWRDTKASGYSGGQIIGGAVLTGFTSALSGYAGGSTGTAGGVAGGLAGVLASALAASAINPALGAVVGSVGLLTTAIGAAGAGAKKAAGDIREWADALKEAATAAEWATTAADTLDAQLRKEKPDTQFFLAGLVAETGVTMTDVAKAMSEGSVQARTALSELLAPIQNIPGMTKQVQEFGSTWDDVLDSLVDGKGSTGTSTLADDVAEAAMQLGWTKDEANNLREALDYIDDEIGEAFTAEEINAAARQIMGVKSATDDTTTTVDVLKEALSLTFDTAQQSADDAKKAFEDASLAVQNFLNPDGGTLAQEVRDAVLAVSSAANTTFEGQSESVANANRGNLVAGLANDVNQAIASAVSEGVTKGADIDAWVLEPLRQQIEDSVLDPTLKQQFLDLLNIDPGELQATIDGVVDTGRLAKNKEEINQFFVDNPALAEISAELSEKGKRRLKNLGEMNPKIVAALSIADDPVQRAKLTKILLTVSQLALDGVTGLEVAGDAFSWDAPIETAGDAGWSISSNLVDGVVLGIIAGKIRAVWAAIALANSITSTLKTALQINSPSRVMMGLGRNVGEGFALGIAASRSAVSKAVKEAAKPVLNKKERASIFGDIFGVSSEGNMGQALEGYQSELASILDRWEGVANAITDAQKALAAGETLSIGQNDVLGESSTSLSINDASGRENRQSLRSALEAAAAVTALELRRGASSSKALAAFQTRIEEISGTFAMLGFSLTEIMSLADRMGFGADDMARYTKRLERERQAAIDERDMNRKERRAAQSANQRQRLRSFVGRGMDNFVGAGFGSILKDAVKSAFAEGGDISSIAGNIVSQTVEALRGQRGAGQATMNQVRSDLFAQIIGPGSALSGQGGVLGAKADFTLAMQTAMSASGDTVSQLREIRKKKARGEKLTAAEQNMLNENAFSLDLRDVTGAQNSQTITTLAASAAAVAQAQLASGMSAGTVNEQFGNRLADIVKSMSALGFNAKDVSAFLESLGYSSEALEQFTTGVNEASSAANGQGHGGNGGNDNPAPTPPGELPPAQIITNQIYLPYGDPQAVALAVANRQAQAAL